MTNWRSDPVDWTKRKPNRESRKSNSRRGDAMYRQIPAMIIFVLAVAAASAANAAMVFSVDAGQDGTADTSWPLASGDAVTIDIRVSNIAEPGLGAMGFKLTYDETVLSVVTAQVDIVNWPSIGVPPEVAVDLSEPGEISFLGYRTPEGTGIAGDDIRMATVTFQRIGTGAATVRLEDRGPSDDFVMFVEDITEDDILDDEIGEGGVSLIVIQAPTAGDVNGDGAVDLADAVLTLQFLSGTESEIVHPTGDATGDNAIGVEEGIWILQKAAELR
jgi:hypothetical protein